MTDNKKLYLVLFAMGAVWGAVFTLSKIALSSGHQPFGLLVWQVAIGLMLSAIVLAVRGKLNCISSASISLFLGVAILGTVFPNYFSFRATQNLPVGVMVLIIALVPLFTLPIALLMGYEKFSWKRITGIGAGAIAIGLLVGPQASLPDASKTGYVFLALLVPLAYGAEGIYITWIRSKYTGENPLDPVQVLFGANLFGVCLALPLALTTGQYVSPIRIWAAPEWAIVINSVANWSAYVAYVWLISKAGPVFAAQVSYLVTGFGIIWAMTILGETYSPYIWLALTLMMAGLFLVQPRDQT